MSFTTSQGSQNIVQGRAAVSRIGNSARAPFEVQSETESGEDSDDEVRRPLGRAARHMQSRVRLASGTQSESVEDRDSSPPRPRQLEPAVDEDEDLYSATPLKSRLSHHLPSESPAGSAGSNRLFVSPAKFRVDEDSDEELPADPLGSKERLAELVAAKRAERLAREKDENAKRKRRSLNKHASSDLPDDLLEDAEGPIDPEVDHIMSDAVRPTRKAGKKALLEMERETQRLSRQQALAHQMKTKKKFTTTDLFARFNFRQPQKGLQQQHSDADAGAEDTTGSSAPNSDGAERHAREPVSTPPSSPPSLRPTPLEKQASIVELGALSKLVPVRQDSIASLAQLEDDDEELPEMADILRSSQMPKPAPVTILQDDDEAALPKKGLNLARLGKKTAARNHDDSSDDDLDIIQPMPFHLRAFDNIQARPENATTGSSKAIHLLKHLAHIGAYEAPRQHKKGARISINPKTLEAQLRRKAKEQARQQQMERIEELRAKGIEIQTTEERDREAEVFENLLEKARQDAVELRKLEKAAFKAELGEGDGAQASDDEDEDEEYVVSDSDDDRSHGGGVEGEEDGERLVDDAAEESDADGEDSGEEINHDADLQEVEEDNEESGLLGSKTTDAIAPQTEGQRRARHSRIIKDDDDDESEDEPAALAAVPRAQPTPTQSADPFAAFNFNANMADASLMSPTQAFQATMQTPTQATQEDSMDILRRIAPPSTSSLPPAFEQMEDDSQLSVVPGSQVPESQRISLNWETQAPETPVPTLGRGASNLSETPGWEPTQDAGLPSPWTIGASREDNLESVTDDHETQSTVRLRVSESPAPSAAPARKGRLVRRQAVVDSDEDEDTAPPASVEVAKRDAFREMARRRAEALTVAEREEAEKEMRHMMDEQAEESEDEYAGIGGDDFVAPETEEDKAMIDSSHVEVDERALAAHFAERERTRQEEETSKLYKDLTTGALRRKQANMFDLDEDEDEVAMRRRQMKQREEARKRKLLLQDDNIAGLAEGRQTKGKDAFLKAIADDEDGEDVLDLSDGGEEDSQQATQDDSTQSQRPEPAAALLETSGNKRRLAESEEGGEARPPAKQRRTQASAFRRPASMLEVQQSVSFLLEEPSLMAAEPNVIEEGPDADESGVEQPEHDSGENDEEDLKQEEKARQNDGGFAPDSAAFDRLAMPPPRLPASQRRTIPKPAVVDRLSLKRGSSTSSNPVTLGRSAWATAASSKAPTLLRRATTSTMAAADASDRGVTTGPVSRENSGSSVKMGGSKKSSLAYQARAEERKVIVEASARRRAENTARIAQMRRNSSVLGKGLTGRFE